MKYIWEAKDIKAGVVFGSSNGSREKFMIGYDVSKIIGGNKWLHISLSDGCVITKDPLQAEEMARRLNEGGYVPLTTTIKVFDAIETGLG